MIPPLKQQQILSLLETGLSIKAVAARMQVARNTIAAIKKKSRAKRCLKCGAMVNVFPCVECRSANGLMPNKKKKIRRIKLDDLLKAYIAEAPEIFHIVEDLQFLHELGLIEHRLFINLGERAKKSFNRIFPPIEERNAKKKKTAE